MCISDKMNLRSLQITGILFANFSFLNSLDRIPEKCDFAYSFIIDGRMMIGVSHESD